MTARKKTTRYEGRVYPDITDDRDLIYRPTLDTIRYPSHEADLPVPFEGPSRRGTGRLDAERQKRREHPVEGGRGEEDVDVHVARPARGGVVGQRDRAAEGVGERCLAERPGEPLDLLVEPHQEARAGARTSKRGKRSTSGAGAASAFCSSRTPAATG